MIRDAWIDGDHRYWLRRTFRSGPHLGFCMLNPSTADAEHDDATIRRCLGFARSWGYAGIEVVNLFSWRSTDPRGVLRNLADAANPITDREIERVARRSPTMVAAWGATPWAAERAEAVLGILRLACPNVVALGRTQSGAPRHPLRLRADTVPEVYP